MSIDQWKHRRKNFIAKVLSKLFKCTVLANSILQAKHFACQRIRMPSGMSQYQIKYKQSLTIYSWRRKRNNNQCIFFPPFNRSIWWADSSIFVSLFLVGDKRNYSVNNCCMCVAFDVCLKVDNAHAESIKIFMQNFGICMMSCDETKMELFTVDHHSEYINRRIVANFQSVCSLLQITDELCFWYFVQIKISVSKVRKTTRKMVRVKVIVDVDFKSQRLEISLDVNKNARFLSMIWIFNKILKRHLLNMF